ncbi:helix-turn-helix domain-containing protein [Sphingomonas sp. RT2P30]|uniref:helix-turn-helix domain-containing protein n=1 Tax=Parasphingomonas halimpatiens TaxID=3096162 RepID=UPI002FC70A42
MEAALQSLSDDLLDGAAAAARHMGLSRSAVYRMTDAGHLPVVRKGRKLFYRKSDLEAAFKTVA